MSEVALPFGEFVLIGQYMADEEGVVILMAEPTHVGIREYSGPFDDDEVTLTIKVKPGYTKIRADSFAEAMEMIRNG